VRLLPGLRRGLVHLRKEVNDVNAMTIPLGVLIRERNERLRTAGLHPQRNPRRSSLEVLSDIRRNRPQFAI